MFQCECRLTVSSCTLPVRLFLPNTLKQWFSSYYMNGERKKTFSFRLKRPSCLYSTPSISWSLLLCISILLCQHLRQEPEIRWRKTRCHMVCVTKNISRRRAITQPRHSHGAHTQRAFFRSSHPGTTSKHG